MVLTFKLADDVVSTLRNVLLARGFVEFVDNHHAPNSWNFQWKTTRYSDADSVGPAATADAQADASVARRQRINHFQKTTGICKKDCLARSLRRMAKTWGSVYGYSPETFILPRESDELAAAMTAATAASADGSPVVWICKPSSSSQGKNIFLITSIAELTYDCSFVVQRYIADPMLVGGYKYDLRIYVLVTSFRPLRVWMYREGLARFSSQKYSGDTSNLFAHLTNASINKESPDLQTEKDVIGSGCKWTIARWFDHLSSLGTNPHAVWERIKDIAVLTILPIVAEVPPNRRAFELFGFDVMLDSALRPWIIEVNASPAIAISGQQDTQVKIPLLNDLLDAVGFPEEQCLALRDSRDNVLAHTHPQFDPMAQQRADAATIAAAQTVAAANAAAASGSSVSASVSGADGTSAPSGGSASTLASSVSGRGERVQRVPRLVKMQMQKGRDSPLAATMPVAVAAAAAPVAAVPSFRTPRTRRPANDVANDSRIPRMPSQSPVRSGPAPSPARTHARSATVAIPSRIPLRIPRAAEADPPPVAADESVSQGRSKDVRAGTNQQQQAHRRRASSTGKMQPAPLSAPATAAAAAAHRRSIARRASVGARTPTATAGTIGAVSGGVRAARGKAAVPTAASLAAAASTAASQSAAATSAAAASVPDMIGDFERIFPFDAATAAAADSITAGAIARLPKGAATPLPLLFGNFARSVVGAVKARIRERDRLIAERRRARELDPTLPLRQPFVATSSVPSPWTPEAIAAAVGKAKAAARAERARLGIPEPVGRSGETDEDDAAKDESQAVEAAIQQEQQQHSVVADA